MLENGGKMILTLHTFIFIYMHRRCSLTYNIGGKNVSAIGETNIKPLPTSTTSPTTTTTTTTELSSSGPVTSAGGNKKCPLEWKYFSNTDKCYKLNSDKMSWKKALKTCQNSSPNPTSTLVSIPDSETNEFLATLTWDLFWTGGHQNSDDDWVWSDGSQWMWHKWHKQSGQPDNWKGIEHFLESNFGYMPGFWNDAPENKELVSVCQYDSNLVLKVKTSTEKYANCDCSMTVEIKAREGSCKTEVLDNVGDDFALGAVDIYTGDQLGTCEDFKPSVVTSIVISHSQGDGWMGEYINIYVGGRIFHCALGKWMKWNYNAGSVPNMEFQCNEFVID